LAFANFIFLEYKAIPSGNSVVIEWITKSEAGVARFIILRSLDNKVFREIDRVESEGAGNNYSFTDDDVYKDSQTFFYKLKAVRSDDSVVEETESLLATPNISGIYRTWGAIKYLFSGTR
jgi:hypothetical protein